MSTRYRFDRFEFFLPGTRQLLMDGAPVALGARTFDFLLCLVKAPGSGVAGCRAVGAWLIHRSAP